MAQARVEPTLEGVQVVRAVAALMVLCFHTASKLAEDYDAHLPVLDAFRHFGMGGVDLFFVLSGFIIS